MATTVPIPYYAPDIIPCPLPTTSEIDAAPDISLEYGGRRIVEIGDHLVVKFGNGVDLIEGENMLFVQENTSIRVPRVYALYSDPSTGKNYIVMEKIPGQTLLSLWPQLSPSEKETIVTTLHDYFNELRHLPPPDYYGSLGRRCLLDGIFWTSDPEPGINGPFTSESALIEAMARKYTYDGRPRFRAEFYRQCLPRLLRSSGPTFTHGDFQRKNIQVHRVVDEESGGGGDVIPKLQVTILDWELSGWYPSYWDYCLAVCALRWDDDWCLWIEKVQDPCVAESAWFQAIRYGLRAYFSIKYFSVGNCIPQRNATRSE